MDPRPFESDFTLVLDEGLFNSVMSPDYISKEINNFLTTVEGGIHAVLFVLSTRNRVSQEEESTFNTLQCIFESKILDYFIVVFTGGDNLEEDDQTLDDYLRENCPEFLRVSYLHYDLQIFICATINVFALLSFSLLFFFFFFFKFKLG